MNGIQGGCGVHISGEELSCVTELAKIYILLNLIKP